MDYEVLNEIKDVLSLMCAGRNREWSDSLAEKLYPEIKFYIDVDLQDHDIEDCGRLIVDEEMVINAIFAVLNKED